MNMSGILVHSISDCLQTAALVINFDVPHVRGHSMDDMLRSDSRDESPSFGGRCVN